MLSFQKQLTSLKSNLKNSRYKLKTEYRRVNDFVSIGTEKTVGPTQFQGIISRAYTSRRCLAP
jgi:hypothetical protein